MLAKRWQESKANRLLCISYEELPVSEFNSRARSTPAPPHLEVDESRLAGTRAHAPLELVRRDSRQWYPSPLTRLTGVVGE